MSWNNQSYWETLNVSVRIFYVIGSDVLYDEKDNQVSFIRVNITESRENLKFKVIEALKYIYRNYNFEYIIKTDDDVINNYELWETKLRLHLDRLHKKEVAPYAGIYCGLHVKVPYRYCSGFGYTIHRSLLLTILSYPESEFAFAEDRTIGKIVYETFGKVSKMSLVFLRRRVMIIFQLRARACYDKALINKRYGGNGEYTSCNTLLKDLYFKGISFHFGGVNQRLKDLYYRILA